MKKLASQNGVEGSSLEELCANKKLHGVVLKELQSAGKAGGLAGIEIIEGVVLADEEWTTANVSIPWHKKNPFELMLVLGNGHSGAEGPA